MALSGDVYAAKVALDRANLGIIDVPALLDASSTLLAAGDCERAHAAALCAVSAAPRSAHAWALLGEAARRIGQHDDAVAALRRAVELDDADLASALSLAELCRDAGKLDEAQSLAAFVLEAARDTPQLRNRAAELHRALREPKR